MSGNNTIHLPTDQAVKAGNPIPDPAAPHTVASDAAGHAKDNNVSNEHKTAELYKLIDGIETAMLTTRAKDGSLVSRAMQTRKRQNGVDIWFVTNKQSHKLNDLEFDNHVNVAYYRANSSDWVSVSGIAEIVTDQAKIEELYAPDLKAWMGDLGDGVHDGGPRDPRIALLFIRATSAHFQLQDKTGPRVLFEVVRGAMTGERPVPGHPREMGQAELETARRAEVNK
ncbi:hypothetical protein HKX48_003037 [Thoreauomyces humboldtii]|nr:hypothetical protein HKX48_003037 [Thoreauomyces humboldtii]